MEDFIFGTLATDELKLVYHRASRRGLQHAYRTEPRDPQPGDAVTIVVDVGPDVAAEHVACYYTLDGSEPEGSRGHAAVGDVIHLEQVGIEWDTFTWGYHSTWQGQLPPQPEGTQVRYKISAWSADGPEVCADWPDVKLTIEHAANYFFNNEPLPDVGDYGDSSKGQIFDYQVDSLTPPDWARQAVFYHIFVDRFYPGAGQDWIQISNLRKRFGGTLWGVAEQMDYIAELGATAIWLSPIFPSPTVHGYNATDYYHVAEQLGGDDALREVIKRAHQRGIRVVLDLVCNHVSHLHPIFQEAFEKPDSPYREWFYFDDAQEHGYRTFFGVSAMPQVNLDHPDARDWMLDVARYWLEEFDVDGYRLDHANGPGPGFWADFWSLCKAIKPDSFCFGEVVEPPEVQLQYVGRLDGLLDFHLCEAIRRRFGRQAWDGERFDSFLAQHLDYFPADFVMPTFLDNHDMDRFEFLVEGDEQALRRAAVRQFQLPGPPIIYYGTEVGLEQTLSKASAVGLEASRGAMLWGDEQDKDRFEFYRSLIRERFENRPWEKGK